MKIHALGSSVEEIIVTRTNEGDGTPDNPTRIIITYWSKEGELLAISDPLKGGNR